MKSLVRIPRALLAFALSATLFTSCKKDNDITPAPDLGTRISGQYTYSELSFGGKTLPASQTDVKGKITVTRKTAALVTMALDFRIKSTGDEFMVLTADDVQVTEEAGEVSLGYQGEKVGTLKGNKLTIHGVDDTDVPFSISVTK